VRPGMRTMTARKECFRLLPILAVCATASVAAPNSELERDFKSVVAPFVNQYCIACHSGEQPAAQFSFEPYSSLATVVEDHPHWAIVLSRLKAADMPPPALPQPSDEDRQRVIRWIESVRSEEARRNAGDPGPVLARRLSNAEYNYTIRDLTGIDMQPTREFPIDPANQAGFDNSGESLAMSPALLTKYLQAARSVAEHMVLTPDGFDFSPHPMLVETDREKYAIQRIVDFYKSRPTDFADYFEAAWNHKHRVELGQASATLKSAAEEAGVSAKYLPRVWRILEGEVEQDVGPIAKLRRLWQGMPSPAGTQPEAVRTQAVRMRDFVVRLRRHTSMQFAAPVVNGLAPGSQPLLNWKQAQFAAHRRDFDRDALRIASDPRPELPEIPRYPGLGREGAPRWRALLMHSRADDPDIVIPDGQREAYEAAFAEFSSVFPDEFYISERGRFFPDDSADKGRLLSAGFHNVMGYARDDTALKELILTDEETRRLDRLWDEFEFIGDYTGRTWDQYFFNQSGEVRGTGRESGTERPADAAVRASSVIFSLRDEYLAKAAEDPSNDPIAPTAIRVHFKSVDDALRRIERMRVEAEPHHLEALLRFAARAYRRSLSPTERDGFLGYYRKLRAESELTHEEAVRDSIVSILMSPDFCYRLDLVDGFAEDVSAAPQVAAPVATPVSGTTRSPLSPYALASRLSYFLWSSMPDDELLSHAASGELQKKDVLLGQVRRMLTDKRVRGLATEFAGNWLRFRQFQSHNSVDRGRFPTFDDDLRQAMFEEPVRFLEDVIRRDTSVLDLIYGDYTFVNPALARHYGMPGVDGDERAWVRVDQAGRYQRGGILPMAAFLTTNSPGLRTSPVQRGYWVVRRVLGEIIPPPPPVVPELPEDEAASDLTVREMLASHRANPLCSACHQKFDSFGLSFEGFGPVGEARDYDLAGRLVDVVAEFPDGSQGEGVRGVRDYIRAERQDDYLYNLSSMLTAYAFSRSLILSDEPLIREAQANLASAEFRFSALIETIVTSPQFLNQRAADVGEPRTVAQQRAQ